MAKRKISNPESEGSESESEANVSEEEEEEEEEVRPKQQGISEYEKQRLSRIADNRARMEALGLSKMASSLMGSSRNSSQSSNKLKGKRKVIEEDEDYRPNDEEDHDHDDDQDDQDDDDDDDDDEDEDFLCKKTPRSRKSKVKSKGSKHKKKSPVQEHLSSSDYVDDDDQLMKAIALSLQDSGEVSGAVRTDVQDATERKGNARLKKKKSFTSRVQMTEDEMVVHFFQFDEAGKGGISVRDLEREATAHDFVWTDKELSDMIHCFDGDGDGKLNLDDFRKIVSRCNMLRTSDNS